MTEEKEMNQEPGEKEDGKENNLKYVKKHRKRRIKKILYWFVGFPLLMVLIPTIIINVFYLFSDTKGLHEINDPDLQAYLCTTHRELFDYLDEIGKTRVLKPGVDQTTEAFKQFKSETINKHASHCPSDLLGAFPYFKNNEVLVIEMHNLWADVGGTILLVRKGVNYYRTKYTSVLKYPSEPTDSPIIYGGREKTGFKKKRYYIFYQKAVKSPQGPRKIMICFERKEVEKNYGKIDE